MPDFTDPEQSMKSYGLGMGALPGLRCMVKIEELCMSIRKCGIDSAGLERAFNSLHGEIWDQLLEKFKRPPASKKAPVKRSQAKAGPATVQSAKVISQSSQERDDFTSW